MSKLLLKNGVVINPVKQTKKKEDILIEDNKIVKLGSNLKSETAQVIDIAGKIITPGLVDMHVHLREPGFEYKETIKTGTKAAAKGGFTTVAAMPNTNPVIDKESLVKSVLATAKKEGVVNVCQLGAITKESKGTELAEIGRMKQAGVVGISDDGNSIMNAEVMRLALKYAKDFNLPVISHCEDDNLAGEGVVHEGYYSTITGLNPIPASAEDVMVARDIYLAKETNSKVHIAHISTKGSVKLVRQAKERGVKVTCEVTPHHFTLTDAEITSFATATKVNPPLRSQEDVEAIKEGLQDGTIDVIATDHAPHAIEEKDVEYDYAPFGISGLETALGLVLTELVKPGVLSLEEAIAKVTIQPAQILGLNKGRLEVGEVADLTVIDLEDQWQVNPTKFLSKGQNTPFAGYKLQGKTVMTIVDGEVVYSIN
ncbi:dihydroorotase, multifunctional complex type [Halobacteroides halobius DSM 5150]|uniref:Dihydroorotase n=1 Tax=Halobacteroides halobius (strain ATCC 35273 / DSM 5150 / MD-1) TaxID=748449 RepID=L0K8L3_HALHC|nr:dihydroorotase [Halobacteroides halobius]AGB40875.1 dihydroorotase, multifunctional complex type [Halobacteroides halobius DSM 5150]